MEETDDVDCPRCGALMVDCINQPSDGHCMKCTECCIHIMDHAPMYRCGDCDDCADEAERDREERKVK